MLAAACFARSSDRFYYWLTHNSIFGNYVRNYIEGKGIPLGSKIFTLSFMWAVMLFTAFLIVSDLAIRAVLILIGIAVTIHVLRIKKLRE